MNYYPNFAELLDQYLTAQDRSGAWLAQRLNVNPATVTRWRNGDSRPNRPEIVMQVADLLGVPSAKRQAFLQAAGYAYIEAAVAATVAPGDDGVATTVATTVVATGESVAGATADTQPAGEAQAAAAQPILSGRSGFNRPTAISVTMPRLRTLLYPIVTTYGVYITVACLVLVVFLIYWFAGGRVGLRSEAAVLHFAIGDWQNLTPGQSAYELILSDGTRDILYAKLSQAPELKGIAWDRPQPRAAMSTNLDYWVEGSYRKVNQVELTARVTNAADEVLGTATVSGAVQEQDPSAAVCILDLQSQLAEEILRVLGITVDPTLLASIDETPTHSCEALQLNNQAAALLISEQWASAQSLLDRALMLDPAYADAHNNLGQLYYRQGEWSLAIMAHQQALNRLPQNAIYEYNLGLAYERLGDYAQSVAAYERALALDPLYVKAYNNLGFTYLQQNELAQALTTLQHGLALAPNAPDLQKNLGRVYLQQGNPQAAITALGQAIDGWPGGLYAEALFYLAVAHQQTGNRAEACNILTIYAAVAHADEAQRTTQADALFTEWACRA